MATEKNTPNVPEELVSNAEDTQPAETAQNTEETTTDAPDVTDAAQSADRSEVAEDVAEVTAQPEPVDETPAEVVEIVAEGTTEEETDLEETEVNAEKTVIEQLPATAESPGGEPSVMDPTPDKVDMEMPEPAQPQTPAVDEHESTVPAQEAPAAEEVPTPAVTSKDINSEEPEETVDFSEEEAELDKLAADSPEFDLGDHHEEENASEGRLQDYELAGKTKDQLLNIFAELLSEKPVQTIRKEVEAIKVAFYKIHRAEIEELRKHYLESGGVPEDFAPPVDNAEQRLKDLFGEYRRRRDEFISQLEKNKENNLKNKLAIIEELKELVNSSETMGSTFNTFRELQNRWREAGPVPQANVKDLWETYNHHVENFYSFIKINKELRDLDLKRNYEAKLALCEEAEALIMEPSIVNAFHRLQKLHDQWRETGPVAHEYKEVLWERFREASSRINKQHQEFFETLKDEQKANLDLKTELCVKTEELANGVWTTRKEWNKASDRLLEIQKVWKTIGFAPKKDNARIYERFRNACDRFFEQKRNFYLQVKAEMDLNLQMKNEICEAAEAIQDSSDWKKTTDELIALQKKWKEVGPVARRHSDAVWKRFRAACDRFFERKSSHFSSKDEEYDKNLQLKRELLTEIDAADFIVGGFELIKDFQRRWSEIGFVPIRQKDAIQKEYKAAMDKAFAILRSSGNSRNMDRFRDKVSNMKNSGDKRLRFERDRLYNKVKQMESEIALLENNIGFFSNSKNAESMIADVRDKIEKLREDMTATIEKINLIDSEE